jgi:hypothetical protein
MENKELYIRYKNNQAFPIDTAYGRGPQGTLPLHTVAHLISACTADQTRRLLGLPEDYGPLTLYSINNGVETSYNSWDPLTVIGENGRLGTNPLIIKSKNDAGQGIFSKILY